MCGILGILRFDGSAPRLEEGDLLSLRHRGPDGRGVWQAGPISLGHTRLAIVDLTAAANQPMVSHDGRYVLVYNGEIYNHPELRQRLQGMGAHFQTRSDTEVVLESYRHWGHDCVNNFRGMFALALWDAAERTLFLARDRCGERPLIYYRDARSFIFASEFKALLPLLPRKPELKPEAVDLYLRYQYTPEPFTLLEGVRKLPPAHTMSICAHEALVKPKRYWDIEETTEVTDLPSDQPGILRRIRDTLEESVRIELRADVPVAVALSGGIDSGAIATLAQKNYPEPMHAFSVGYPGRPPYDEREQARDLAERLGLIFHEVELPVDDFVDYFPKLVRILDEPIADPAAFGHYAVPKAAAEMGIKVLLTGIGGDELFWGYDWTTRAAILGQAPNWRAALRRRVPIGWRKRFLQTEAGWENVQAGFLPFFDLTPDFTAAKRMLPALYGPAMRELPLLNAYAPVDIGRRSKERVPAAVLRLLFDTWLVSNCLNLGDRVSMSVGVESRLPFLEPGLVNLVMALRLQTPDHRLGQKAWLRAALQGVLPDAVLTRPKAGFQPPVWEWLAGVVERNGWLIDEGRLRKQGILNSGVSEKLLNTKERSYDCLFMAYKIVLLESWLNLIVSHRDHRTDASASMTIHHG